VIGSTAKIGSVPTINNFYRVLIMQTILILESRDDRIASFQKAVVELGSDFRLRIWRDARSMIADCAELFPNASLISLDYELNPQSDVAPGSGTGLDVARFLGDFLPVCPVVIHSSNTDGARFILKELRSARWIVEQIAPVGIDWIERKWLGRVRALFDTYGNTWSVHLPPDHNERLDRMRLSLDGLGLGDALGQMLSYRAADAPKRLAENKLPPGPWLHTDDTEMAISIVAVLGTYGELDQDVLARRFARRFARYPDRSYGKMTRMQLQDINAGKTWQDTSINAFGGRGSMGNGGAMRVAPLGAYFANDLGSCAGAACASAFVTHAHPEGVAGTVAVAVAAAMAWQLRDASQSDFPQKFFAEILRITPESNVRQGILLAQKTPAEVPLQEVAKLLGNGSLVTAPDTVPLCLWMAAHHPRSFAEAIGTTISVDGDCDTNAAIVGGIVALSAGRECIPDGWLQAREVIQI
jgi:ADP-ribosylglycohydrolase